MFFFCILRKYFEYKIFLFDTKYYTKYHESHSKSVKLFILMFWFFHSPRT